MKTKEYTSQYEMGAEQLPAHRFDLQPISELLENHQQLEGMYKENQAHHRARVRQREIDTLKQAHHKLDVYIRDILLKYQAQLFRYGYHTGIEENKLERRSEHFITALSLHMSAFKVPNDSSPQQDFRSENTIKFYRLGKGEDIACIFKGRNLKSEVYPIEYQYTSHCFSFNEVDEKIKDFINYTLLSNRNNLNADS